VRCPHTPQPPIIEKIPPGGGGVMGGGRVEEWKGCQAGGGAGEGLGDLQVT